MGTRHRRTCQTPLHLAFVLQSGFTNLTDLQPPVLLPQMASPAAFLMEEIMMESELVDLSACPMGWEGHDPSWPPPPPHPCQIDMCSLQNGMYGTHATEDECLAAECADAGAIRDTTTDPSCVPTERRYPSLVLPSSCNVAGYAAEPSTGCAMSYDVSWLVRPPTRPLATISRLRSSVLTFPCSAFLVRRRTTCRGDVRGQMRPQPDVSVGSVCQVQQPCRRPVQLWPRVVQRYDRVH